MLIAKTIMGNFPVRQWGFSHSLLIAKMGNIPDMFDQFRKRLARVIDQDKRSIAAIERAAGFKAGSIREIIDDGRGHEPKITRAAALAEALGVSLNYLLYGEEGTAPANATMIEVRGTLAAGIWSEAREWPIEDQYAIPVPTQMLEGKGVFYGAKVEGMSMDLVFPPGSLVILRREVLGPRDLKVGRRYHVERQAADGTIEQTLKRVDRSNDGSIWLKGESSDPAFQAAFPLAAIPGEAIGVVGEVVSAIIPA